MAQRKQKEEELNKNANLTVQSIVREDHSCQVIQKHFS
jgi:hypothetical protein